MSSSLKPPGREIIEQQASVWTARLETGALTAADQQELAAWLAADPEHRWVLSRYRELCAQLATQVPVLTDSAEVEAVVARATARRRWRRAALPVFAAAAALIVAATIWWLQPSRVETLPAERRTLALADGSRVELNARTSLEVSLGRSERHVRLTRGEALFQVAHDAARPFFVETPRGTVRVTGTIFNVRETAAAGVQVTVLEGNVQVRAVNAAADAVTPLAVGDQAALGATGVSVHRVSRDEAQNVVAWRVGQAAFQQEPLNEALAHFAPYHARKITVNPEVAALRIGGRYSLDDLDGFLTAIEQVLPVVVLRDAGGGATIAARPRVAR